MTKPGGYKILRAGKMIDATLEQWGEWFQSQERIVGRTRIKGNILVSTVCLGIDHGGYLGRPHQYFETMVFDPKTPEDFQERYETYEQAVEGHERAVRRVLAWEVPNEL